jgi:hypothetical protein
MPHVEIDADPSIQFLRASHKHFTLTLKELLAYLLNYINL